MTHEFRRVFARAALVLASGMFAFGIADYASEVMRYPCKFVKSVGIHIYARN